MDHADKRNWSYSLRTMFVALALLAIPLGWLAWQLEIVRQRQATKLWLAVHGGSVPEYPAGLAFKSSDASIPIWRHWLGNEPAPVVLMAQGQDPADEDRVRRQLPEADIMTFKNILPPGQLLPPPVRAR